MSYNKEVILIVEDEPDDMFFIKKAFADAGIKNPVQEAEDCGTALDYLNGKGLYADRQKHPLPILVLLDLKLPDKSGLEVARKIKEMKPKRTAVIVFTSSSNTADIKAAYQGGATSYVVKPLSVAERNSFAVMVRDYWLGYNLYPPQ